MSDQLGPLVDELFGRPPDEGISLAFVMVQSGEVIVECYGTQPDTAFGPGRRSRPTRRSSRGAPPSR
jgi:hypothetical protein